MSFLDFKYMVQLATKVSRLCSRISFVLAFTKNSRKGGRKFFGECFLAAEALTN